MPNSGTLVFPIGIAPARAQPLDQHAVLGRHHVAEDGRAAGPGKADRRLELLERDGQAVKRAHRLAAREPPVGVVGERQAAIVVELGDDGVDLGVDPLDARQVRRHQLARRKLARTDPPREIARAREAEVGGGRRLGRHLLDPHKSACPRRGRRMTIGKSAR